MADKYSPQRKIQQLSISTDSTLESIILYLIYCHKIILHLYNYFEKNDLEVPFLIKNFPGHNFKLFSKEELEKHLDITSNENEPILTAADFIAFIDQLTQSLNHSTKIGLSPEQQNTLLQLLKNRPFSFFGLPDDITHITLEELKKIENFDDIFKFAESYFPPFFKFIKTIKPKIFEDLSISEEQAEQLTISSLINIPLLKPEEPEQNLPKEQPQKKEVPQEIKELIVPPSFTFNDQVNLAQLDDSSKLYVQSLAIITINQAIAKYYSGEGPRPTFDSLSLETRQQLMSVVLEQIQSLLASGNFNLQELIKNPSARLNFANQASLGLLFDPKTINSLTKEIALWQNISDTQRSTLQEENRQIPYLTDRLANHFKVENGENILSTSSAEAFFTRAEQSEEKLTEHFVQNFHGIDDRTFIEEINKLLHLRQARGEQVATQLISSNLVASIKTFIQEGFPIEFIDSLSYASFSRFFGRDLIDERSFQNPEIERKLKNLIICYWYSKRGEWATKIRQEILVEQYSLEEISQKFYRRDVDAPSDLEEHFLQLRAYNQTYDANDNTEGYHFSGNEVMEALAGRFTEDIQLQDLQKAQKGYLSYFESYFSNKLIKASRSEITYLLNFYYPQEQFDSIPDSNSLYFREIWQQFSPYDLMAINANNTLQMPYFSGGDSGSTAQFNNQSEPLIQNLMGNRVLDLNDSLSKKALKTGLKAAAAAITGGGSEVFVKALEGLEKIPGIGQAVKQLEDAGLNKIIEYLKELIIPLLLGGLALIAFLIAPLAGIIFLAVPVIFGLVKSGILPGLVGNNQLLAGGPNTSVLAAKPFAQPVAVSKELAGTTAQSTGILKGLATTSMQTAAQAVGGTLLVTTVGFIMYKISTNNAFIANFPAKQDSFLASVEKTSKYASVSKTAKIVTGCSALENNGTKCKDPAFPVTIEYEITIASKGDYTIKITGFEDKTTFKQNEKAWKENEGKEPPGIADITKTYQDFPELTTQTGTSTETESKTGTVTSPSPEENSTDTTQDNNSALSGSGVIHPGEKLTIKYSLSDLDAKYKHTAITNTLDVKFYYTNSLSEGVDTMKTAARVCLGDCSGGAGCWPTSGTITQLPFGANLSDDKTSHRPTAQFPKTGYLDAYDIGAPKDTPVYVPYTGKLCFVKCDDKGYGCYYILTKDDGTQLLFAHFENPNADLSKPNSCMDITSEGAYLNGVGTRGNSNGYHLHYEADYQGVFGSRTERNFSILETLVPETVQGHYPPVMLDQVKTCY